MSEWKDQSHFGNYIKETWAPEILSKTGGIILRGRVVECLEGRQPDPTILYGFRKWLARPL